MICTTDGKIMLDFVGKMENIESDFTKICNTIGVKAKLPRLNTTNHRDYRSYYNKNTSRIIEKYFIEDIELFNYDF
jgi:hypothetical protein